MRDYKLENSVPMNEYMETVAGQQVECAEGVERARMECAQLLNTARTMLESNVESANLCVANQHQRLHQLMNSEQNSASQNANAELIGCASIFTARVHVGGMEQIIQEQLRQLQALSTSSQEESKKELRRRVLMMSAHLMVVCMKHLDELKQRAFTQWVWFVFEHRLRERAHQVGVASVLCSQIQTQWVQWAVVQCWNRSCRCDAALLKEKERAAADMEAVASILGEQASMEDRVQDGTEVRELRASLQEASELLASSSESWKNVIIQSACIATVQILSRLRRFWLRGALAAWMCDMHKTKVLSLVQLLTGSSALLGESLLMRPSATHNMLQSVHSEAFAIENNRLMIHQVRCAMHSCER